MHPATLLRYLLVAAVLAGCSSSRSRGSTDGEVHGMDGGTEPDGEVHGMDGGTVPDGDAGVPSLDSGPGRDAGPACEGGGTVPDAPAWSPLTSGETGAAADYDCLCDETTPTGGTPVTVTLRVLDFQEGTPLASIPVEAWSDGQVRDACTAPVCTSTVTDAAGEASVTVADGGWLAVRTEWVDGPTPAATHLPSINQNLRPSGDGAVEAWAMSQATANLIPTVLGFRRVEGRAIVVGEVQDCSGAPVAGARVQLVEPSGVVIPEGPAGSDVHYRYYDGTGFPSASTTETQADGLFIVGNVPVSSSGLPLRLEVWGRLPAETAPRVVAAERVHVGADTATIVNPTPLRSDLGG